MKKIGLIMTTCDSELMIQLYKGIQEQAQQEGFSTYSTVISPSTGASKIFNRGEFYIFEKLDFNLFDGLIVALNAISEECIKEELYQKLEKFNKPIIAIDCKIPEAYHIHTSNQQAMKELVGHLIQEHNCKKINFISGPRSNSESIKRKLGYEEALQEAGIPVEQERIYEGTFYIEDGKKAVYYFDSHSKTKDYDAIVCSNDMVAMSVYHSLLENGVSVPDQVKVTGFDNIFEAGYEDISLTTIQKPQIDIGKKAVMILSEAFEKKATDKRYDLPSYIVFRQSCGCKKNDKFLREKEQNIFLKSFSEGIRFQMYSKYVLEEFMNSDSFDDYLMSLKRFINKINPQEFCLLLNPRYMEDFEVDLSVRDKLDEESLNTNFIVALAYQDGKFNNQVPFLEKKEQLLCGKNHVAQYVLSPLHFREHQYGYLVFGNADQPFMRNAYSEWLIGMSHAIDNVRSRLLLNKALEQIHDISVHDQLTGTYNRLGLNQFWTKFESKCKENNGSLMLLFIDVNGLKVINDQFGHEHGDNVIATIGKALKRLENENIVACRYGGDEFILMGYGIEAPQAKELMEQFQSRLQEENRIQKQEYLISASVGMYINDGANWMDMESCIQFADEEMYICKKEYKRLV